MKSAVSPRSSALRLAAVSLAVLALVGCERIGGLAPFTNMAGGVPDSAAGAITVQKGDNAYSLSRRYNVPLRDLIEVNRLSPPYKLEVGQRLALPTARQYIVQKGDTLYGISRMHNVDVSELTQLNNLTPPYAVQAGQPLRLPGAGGGAAPGSAPGSVAGPVVLAEASPPPGRSAGRGSIQATELPASGASVPPNAPASGGVVATPLPAGGVPAAGEPEVAYQPGQAPVSLRPPDRKPGVTAEPLPANPAASEPAPAAVASPVPPGLPAGRTAPAQQEVAAAAPPKPEPKAEAGAPPPRGGARFLWPVKGKLISGYGPKPDGLHNDGLNIAASKGTAVVAADNGVVAYAGNELRGFGNLLLLKHADGWITAYAHLDRIDVERGATVKRGQAVGKVGQTGSVSSPQLHFELRKGSQAVDPTDQMDRKSIEGAFRDGPLGPG